MPSHAQHIAKCKSNLAFVTFAEGAGDAFLDWVILGYFLTSLHHVEAYFDVFFGQHYGNHVTRRRAVDKDTRLAPFFNDYRRLEIYSQTARYGVKRFDKSYIQRRVMPHFKQLRNAIESFDPSLQLT